MISLKVHNNTSIIGNEIKIYGRWDTMELLRFGWGSVSLAPSR
jgi:hypothetical protein